MPPPPPPNSPPPRVVPSPKLGNFSMGGRWAAGEGGDWRNSLDQLALDGKYDPETMHFQFAELPFNERHSPFASPDSPGFYLHNAPWARSDPRGAHAIGEMDPSFETGPWSPPRHQSPPRDMEKDRPPSAGGWSSSGVLKRNVSPLKRSVSFKEQSNPYVE